MPSIEKSPSVSDNPRQAKDPPKSSAKEKQDKPFNLVLDEVIKKAYPNLRRIK